MFQIDTYQVSIFFCFYFVFFLLKSLVVGEKSRTFASAFRESPEKQPQKEFFERLT